MNRQTDISFLIRERIIYYRIQVQINTIYYLHINTYNYEKSMKKVICIPKVFCLSVGVQIKLDKHAKIDNVYFKLKG